MGSVPERWRFLFDGPEESHADLTWPEAVRVVRASSRGELFAQTDHACVSLEFNPTQAAVVYMGRDRITQRPYILCRPAESQDLRPSFCGGCGLLIGDRDEYLSRFLGREDGIRLFEAVLVGPGLPSSLPVPAENQPVLPGLEGAVAERSLERSLEWRPLAYEEREHT